MRTAADNANVVDVKEPVFPQMHSGRAILPIERFTRAK